MGGEKGRSLGFAVSPLTVGALPDGACGDGGIY